MKMNHPAKKNSQQGYTLIETLLVAGILAIVIGSVVGLALSSSASQTARAEAQTIDSAGNKLKSIYGGRPSYAGLDTGVAQDLQIWPESMGDPAMNQFGGAVAVNTPPDSPKGPAANGSRQFQIDWESVSADACPELASAQTSAIGVDIDGVEVFNRGVSDLDVAAISANCDDGVTVSFIYGK
ncbi:MULTISPECIES: type 4 pilus major pilin [Marinobacter]|nr:MULTISPECIES: type 4 pilus major pilin [Marinobacter]|tara:strand:- start:741 stop:1289 length:549 start_codon:yes stop_codon:yes gene_type:complete